MVHIVYITRIKSFVYKGGEFATLITKCCHLAHIKYILLTLGARGVTALGDYTSDMIVSTLELVTITISLRLLSGQTFQQIQGGALDSSAGRNRYRAPYLINTEARPGGR